MGGENGNMLTRDEARELYARFTGHTGDPSGPES